MADIRKKAKTAIKRQKIINISLSVVLLVAVLGAFAFLYLSSDTNYAPGLTHFIDNLFKRPPELAAVVNDEPITMTELDDRYALIPEPYKELISKEDVLDQMIDEKLLLQQAHAEGITVSEDEVDQRINELLEENGITMDELEQSVEDSGLTIEDLREFYRKELLLGKFLNETVLTSIEITDTDIQDYYFRNIDQFTIPEAANVSHILICHNESIRCVSNLTKEEALQQAEEVKAMVNETNFGELALEYSDEPAAVVTKGNLGWVSREDPFDETFLNHTFEIAPGNVSQPVETEFGFHIIKVFDKREEETIDLDTVYDQINQTLSVEMESELFDNYLEQLKDEAEIIRY